MAVFETERPEVPIEGSTDGFPVRRIYCVGQNYAAHARELGGDPEREPPFFFMKPADTVVPGGGAVPYPPRTADLHHEIELVVALGREGRDIAPAAALGHVYGYAAGIDLTRRDLQKAAKLARRPWSTAKGFDRAAPITAIRPAAAIGHPEAGRIWLRVNGELRQDGDIADMTWKIPEIIAELSTLFALRPGDLVFTGTPAGVGPLVPGDRAEGGIDGVAEIAIDIAG